jgi:diacylglycerol kinase (ATP)
MTIDIRAELARFGNTARWSWDGWQAAWAREKSLRQWTLANAISVTLALAVDLDGAERGLILGLGLLILAAELINTAIEEVVDDISEEQRERARRAKDCGSAGVAVTAIAAGVAWLCVLVG